MPQFCASLVASTHCPPHSIVPEGQPHEPPEQARPAAHALPQTPQLSGSLSMLAVLTQAAPHRVSPGMHVVAQPPWEQT